jgi:hypothetical protein
MPVSTSDLLQRLGNLRDMGRLVSPWVLATVAQLALRVFAESEQSS